MFQLDVHRHSDAQRLIDLFDHGVEPLEVAWRLADHDQSVRVRVGFDAEDVRNGRIRRCRRGASVASLLTTCGSGTSAASTLEEGCKQFLHFDRIRVLQVIDSEDIAFSGRGDIPCRFQKHRDFRENVRFRSHRDRVRRLENRHRELFTGADFHGGLRLSSLLVRGSATCVLVCVDSGSRSTA